MRSRRRQSAQQLAGRGVGFGQRQTRQDDVAAPDRDLERIHGLTSAAKAQKDAADEQMGFAVVRREEHSAAQFGERVGVAPGLRQSPPVGKMEAGELALLALS